MGRPPEHLKETLETIAGNIDSEDSVSVKSKSIKEPVIIEGQKDLYTSFAEIEVEIEEVIHLALLMFKYMPANVEILYPELIALTNNSWSEILSEITRRLHAYDDLTKAFQFEKAKLLNEIKDLKGKDNSKNKKNKK